MSTIYYRSYAKCVDIKLTHTERVKIRLSIFCAGKIKRYTLFSVYSNIYIYIYTQIIELLFDIYNKSSACNCINKRINN